MSRRYSSPLRVEQARATRRRILDAARAQFLDAGWSATTVKVIADAAAVAPATVYVIFRTKRAVLSALIDESLESALPDPEHPAAWSEIVGCPDQWERVRRLTRLMSVTLPRMEPFERVVREGAGVDEEIAGLARDLIEWRRAMAARIVEVLAGQDGLRPGLDREEAADLVFALGGPEVHYLLVEIRGWSPQQFDTHLADLLGRLIGSREGTPSSHGPGALERMSTTQKKARNSPSEQRHRRDPHRTCGSASRPPDLLA